MHIIILRTCVCERACVKMREQAPGKRTEGRGSKAEPSGANPGRKQGRVERSEPRTEARRSRAERTRDGSKAEPSGANRGRKQGRAERSESRAEECGRGRKETEILEVTQGSCF